MCIVRPDKEHVAISSTQTTGVQTDTTAILTLSSYSTDIEPVTNSNKNSGSMYSSATCQTLSLVDSALDSSENSCLENEDSVDTVSPITSNVVPEINVGYGSSMYKAKYYLKKIKDMCACFDKVASKVLNMEQQNKQILENMHFADVIHSLGNELILCGNKLQKTSNNICMTHTSKESKPMELSSNVSQPKKQFSLTAEVSTLESNVGYHQDQHSSRPWPTVNATANYWNKELWIVLTPIDSVSSRHKQCKWQTDVEYIPDNSSTASTSESDDSEHVITKHFTLPGRKPKIGVDEKYKCKYCGVILSSQQALDSHLRQHKGVTFVCQDCGKTFKFQCSFDNHIWCHVLGFPKCHICKQEFNLKSTLYNHMKKHDRRYFTCTVSASCPHRMCSLAMHTEHIKFGHLTK